MNTPDSSSPSTSEGPDPVSSVASAASASGGSESPRSAEDLPSIPQRAGLQAAVHSASEENRVKTGWPKFFNSLFRRQGVVNKHLIQALQSVEGALGHLAHEIECRDKQMGELTARLAQEAADARNRTDCLFSSVRSMQRRLDEQQTHVEEMGNLADQIRRLTARFDSKITLLESRFDEQAAAIALGQRQIEAGMTRLDGRLDEQAAAAVIKQRQMDAALAATRAAAADHRLISADLTVLREQFAGLTEVVADLSKRQDSAAASVNGARTALQTLMSEVGDRLQQVAAAEDSETKAAMAIPALAAVNEMKLADSDGLYVALEARFRGSPQLIRERQMRYLPVIEEVRKRIGMLPPVSDPTEAHPLSRLQADSGVLDLGCGRGEWLGLLKEQHVPAIGVDQNRIFLETCRRNGMEVIDADLIEFIRAAPDESVAVITGFHIIEHLPMPLFQELCRQTLRVLRRGGAAIYETPNPGNMLTSSLNFWLDPTHQRPVHPELARFFFESVGFTSVRLEFMSPYDESSHVGPAGDPLARRFNDYFYGPQDYAVIGLKP